MRRFLLPILLAPLACAVEFRVDTSRAPGLELWARNASQAWTEAYPLIREELASPGYTPPSVIRVAIDPKYDGVAEWDGSAVRIATKFIRENPQDVDGAMVHEIAHVVQGYGHNVPMWLVDGIADYVRFFRWRPGTAGHINPDRAHYNGSYRITASFLNYVAGHYDREAVRKLNRAAREGRYRDALFQEITGKSVQALGEEWHSTLPRTPDDFAPEAQSDVEPEGFPWWRLAAGGAGGYAAGLVFTWWRRRRRSG